MKGLVAVAALTTLSLVAACGGDEEGWTPVLEGTPPAFLEEEIDGALSEVRALRESPGTQAETASALEEVEARLDGLASVYLPLYRAKILAANAYRRVELGEPAAAGRLLDQVEEQVLDVSRATGGSLEGEMEGVLEDLADVRVALEAASPEVEGTLRRLTESLDNLLTRAGLYL